MKFAGAATPLVQARVENMEEMTVQTDQLNMNTGYGISDMQVNFVTRRGTNSFHGRVYEDFRNAALNANTYLNDSLTAIAPGNPATKIRLSEMNLAAAWGVQSSRTTLFFGTSAMAKQPGSEQPTATR